MNFDVRNFDVTVAVQRSEKRVYEKSAQIRVRAFTLQALSLLVELSLLRCN